MEKFEIFLLFACFEAFQIIVKLLAVTYFKAKVAVCPKVSKPNLDIFGLNASLHKIEDLT